MSDPIKRWGGRVVRASEHEHLVPTGTRGRVDDHGDRIRVTWEGKASAMFYDKDVAKHFMTFSSRRR